MWAPGRWAEDWRRKTPASPRSWIRFAEDLAARYLADANLSVSQAAWLLGYHDVSAFSHAFKRWPKMTPAETHDQLLRGT